MILWEAVRLVSSCRLYRCLQTILVFSTVGCDVSVAVSATGPKPHHTILLNTGHDPHQRWQAECQSCPLISQECPTPAPGPHNTMPWHNITQHTIQYHTIPHHNRFHHTCIVEMWAGLRPNSLPTPVSELSITKPTLGSVPRAWKQAVKEIRRNWRWNKKVTSGQANIPDGE